MNVPIVARYERVRTSSEIPFHARGQLHTSIRSGIVSGQGQSDQWAERIMPGYALGTFWGPVFTRVANETIPPVPPDTAPVWRPGQQLFQCTTPSATCVSGETRAPSADDYRVIGNANPDFSLGFHNQLTWKKFDISFLVRAVVGQDVFNNTALVYSTKGNALQGKNFLAPALTDPTGIHEPAIYSSRWIEDGSFVRLQNVTIDYALDLPILTRSARSAHLYVSADNVLLLTGYSGLDPEVSSANQANKDDVGLAARGIDYLSYPRSRTITGGLRVVF